MNYENLKDAIVAVIKQNGNEEITGNILQQVLVAMVNSLGSGYQFRGIATPETNPGTPDQRVFYLASARGTYPDFGFIVSDEICALVYDTAWHKQTIIALDQEPTEDSGNLISSGAIYTALQNLADAYMQLVESAVENHLASFDGDGQVKDAGVGLDDLALPSGHYPDLFAGFAGNLVDTRSAGTPQGPYAFRQSGGDGVNYMRKILGRTEAFNQIRDNGHIKLSGTFSVNAVIASQNFSLISGHNYLVRVSDPAVLQVRFRDLVEGLNPAYVNIVDGSAILSYPISTNGSTFLQIQGVNGTSFDTYINIYDLTLEGLGLTTAAQFQSLHPLPYYNYNAGVLKNNAATALETTGFNQWNEESEAGFIDGATGENASASGNWRSKNYIPVFPSTAYYLKTTGTANFKFRFYDANKNYLGYTTKSGETAGANIVITTPDNCAYFRFAMEQDPAAISICINLSDASRNGEYEPYWKRDIVLGLNNLACHDENNNAVVVNGLDGVGTAQDELVVENGLGKKINKRFVRYTITGNENAAYISAYGGYFAITSAAFPWEAGSEPKVGIISKKYTVYATNPIPSSCPNNAVMFNTGYYGTTKLLLVKDSSYSQDNTGAAQVLADLVGTEVCVQLYTPIALTLDNPIPALIEVDNLGTEKRLPEDTADNPQGPFECDSNYSISTANLVRILSQ